MTCPKCGAFHNGAPSCPKCGVIFARLHSPGQRRPRRGGNRPARPARQPHPERPERPVPVAKAAPRPPAQQAAPGPQPPAPAARSLSDPPLPVVSVSARRVKPPITASLREVMRRVAPLSFDPRPWVIGLIAVLAGYWSASVLVPALKKAPAPAAATLADTGAGTEANAPPSADSSDSAAPVATDVPAADDSQLPPPPLPTLAPTAPPASEQLAALLAAGRSAQAARRFDEAEARLQEAVQLEAQSSVQSTAPQLALAALYLQTGRWQDAERVANDVVQRDRASADGWRLLAYALFRQDRNSEARDAATTAQDLADNAAMRALLARLNKESQDERGMTEQRLSHFHVRYDGAAHDAVGREVLRLLERHHATLTRTFGEAPAATIPVILFSSRAYYTAAGAPAWSGGNFDGFDGRIRVPIAGLTERLDPDLDATLLHELAHAFIADRSRGLAPRELHEGVAQYLEGKRSTAYGGSARRAAATARIETVGAFYLQALSLAEYLYGQRGQGGINEVLAAMAASGNVDDAFTRVYGRDFGTVRSAWLARARQETGTN